ncbi:MAG: PQQ-dependent sugar dehydrogenase [Candidatus Methylacidiphilales bacterium]|nr:PQQ-dependent sugar dehydrogenase [Candidatus Methylacidiphilales bacterium]
MAILLIAPGTTSWGQLTRIPNNTLSMPLAPPPVGSYYCQDAYTGFTLPIALASPPGETDRLFVVERNKGIQVLDLSSDPASRQLFLDCNALMGPGESLATDGECGLLGLAFHPEFASNRTFFIFYSFFRDGKRYQRVARLQASASNPNTADPATLAPVLTQLDEASNHNGGDLHFGPDGFLYISLGDEGGQNDQLDNSRWIDRDFFCGILRIDVDRRNVGLIGGSVEPNAHPSINLDSNNKARYAIPSDNPFLPGATGAISNPLGNGAYPKKGAISASKIRTEFWAVGFRNPWRFSFDPDTGRLLAGDVGSNSREEIDLVARGGNYGWPFREGLIAGPRSNPPANPGSPRINPVFDYDRSLGYSVTGGRVYRGTNLPELYGSYIFADFGSGRVFALTDAGNATWTSRQLMNTETGTVAFGTDPGNGDLLLVNINAGKIRRLMATQTGGSPLPVRLSDTGAFRDLATLDVQPGIVGYTPKVPFWSDYAIKTRWFSIPSPSPTFGFNPDSAWSLPSGSVWIKHFEIETTRGNPATRRRLETRFLVKNDSGAYGVTYRWRPDQSDADLVPDSGQTEFLDIDVDGTVQTQKWRYPARNECMQCHTPQGGYALGFNTRQLNTPHAYPEGTANQIEALRDAGYLAGAPTSVEDLPTLAQPDDEARSVEFRARSALQVNCAQCHQPGGPAPTNWDARISTPLADAGILNGSLSNNGGNPNARVLVPGSTANSMLLTRLRAPSSPSRMPPLGSHELDRSTIDLVTRWISGDAQGRLINPMELDGDYYPYNTTYCLANSILEPFSAGGYQKLTYRSPGNIRIHWNNPDAAGYGFPHIKWGNQPGQLPGGVRAPGMGLPANTKKQLTVHFSWAQNAANGWYHSLINIWCFPTIDEDWNERYCEIMIVPWSNIPGDFNNSLWKRQGTFSTASTTWTVLKNQEQNTVCYRNDGPQKQTTQFDIMPFVRDAVARKYLPKKYFVCEINTGFEIQSGTGDLTIVKYTVTGP